MSRPDHFPVIVALAMVAVISVAAAVYLPLRTRKYHAPETELVPPAISAEKRSADALYASGNMKGAERSYEAFVENHKTSTDPHVQDLVGQSRINLAFIASRGNDYQRARAILSEAQKEYKGTGEFSADFGGIKDEAAYQSAVCLAAMGKKQEAEQAFEAFLKEHPESPLVVAAHKRLERLNGGKANPRWDIELQTAINFQEKQARKELAMCGPKALSKVLELLGKPSHPYQDLAKLAGTNGSGTTLEGMKAALGQLGTPAFGYELNAGDFGRLEYPVIWLVGQHYLVALRSDVRVITVFDPTSSSERQLKLPNKEDADFRATVLTFQPLRLGDN